MTFWAQQKTEKAIDVHVTYGPISITVLEDVGHLRSFWGELGRLLDQVENPPAADEKAS
jgi:hypothetical protein